MSAMLFLHGNAWQHMGVHSTDHHKIWMDSSHTFSTVLATDFHQFSPLRDSLLGHHHMNNV